MGEDPPVATARKIEGAVRRLTASSLSAATGLTIEYVDPPKLTSRVTLPEWMTVPQLPPLAPSPAAPRAWLVMEPAVAAMTAVLLLLLPLTIFLGCYILCCNRMRRQPVLAGGGEKIGWSTDPTSLAWLPDPAYLASPQRLLPRSPPGVRDLLYGREGAPFQLQQPPPPPPQPQLRPSPSQRWPSPSDDLKPSRSLQAPSSQPPSSRGAASGEVITIHRWRNSEASPGDEDGLNGSVEAAGARSPEIKLTEARERRSPLNHDPSRAHSRASPEGRRVPSRAHIPPEGLHAARREPSRVRIRKPLVAAEEDEEAAAATEEALLHDIYADAQRHNHAASAVRLRRELSQWRTDLQRREANLEHGLTLVRSPQRAGAGDRYSPGLPSDRCGPKETGTKSSPPTRMQRRTTPQSHQNIRQVL